MALVLDVYKEFENQVQLASYIFEYTSSFMKNQFEDQTLVQYYANVVMKD
jgi:hypothetical protein